MFVRLPSATDAHALQAFRDILSRMDPEARVVMDDNTGEVLVKGQFDAKQLSTAIEASRLGMPVVHAGGGGCCGGCGGA